MHFLSISSLILTYNSFSIPLQELVRAEREKTGEDDISAGSYTAGLEQ